MRYRGFTEMTSAALLLSLDHDAGLLTRSAPDADASKANNKQTPPGERRAWPRLPSFLKVGGRKIPLPLNEKEKQAGIALRSHDLFDDAWYLGKYPDVARGGVDPLHHLIRHGIFEGRSPNRQIMQQALNGFRPTASASQNERLARYLDIVATLATGEDHASQAGTQAKDLLASTSRAAGEPEKGCLAQFSDAIVARGLERFEKFPLFREQDYFALNRPLSGEPGLVAHRHAFLYGLSEGRSIFERQTIANELGRRSRPSLTQAVVSQGDEARVRRLAVSVAVNRSGNSFLHDIAQSLVHDLSSEGHEAVLIDDRDDLSAMRDHNIIVAPHEFFFVGQGLRWSVDEVVGRSVMFNTEQPQTIWFDRAIPFNMLSRGVIDMSPQVASMYAEGMPAIHCDLGGAAMEDVLPNASDPFFRILPKAAKTIGSRTSALDERCLDVSFFGGISSHRDRFFSQTARFFSDYKTLFYCRRVEGPLASSGPIDLLASARHAAFHSKIVLNIHRDEFGFFEWHRIVRLGIETGAVVVSEPCLPHPDFKPNIHYFEESGRHIQNLVEWLLKTPEGRAQAESVRRAALDLVNHKRKKKQAGRRIAQFLDNLEGPLS